MRQLNSILTGFVLLMLLGCGGGKDSTGTQLPFGPAAGDNPAGIDADSTVRLVLDAENLSADEWSLMLRTQDAADLYQIAGSMLYPQDGYELLSVEAGGGLGGPDEAYFVNSESDSGKLDFAYTSRWYGRKNNGELNLLRLRIRAIDGFRLDDFELPQDSGMLRLRNSDKQDLEAEFSRSGS